MGYGGDWWDMSAPRTRAYLSTAETTPEALRTVADRVGAPSVVVVLTRTRPGPWLASWPGERAPKVVDLSGTSGSSLRLPADTDQVVAGLDQTDLTGVSMVLESLLRRAGPTVVYLESLTGLCLSAGPARTTRFVRNTVEQVTTAGGTILADVTPEAHHTAALRVLSSPFQEVVDSGAATPAAPGQS
jgi:hypothetical protein